MPNGVFRSFNKENRPLSLHLNQRFLRPLLQQVERLSDEDVTAPTTDIVQGLVVRVRVEPPSLGGQRAAGAREGELRPGPTTGVRLPTTRYHVAVQLDGDVEVLDQWPDKADDGVVPVDAGLADWTVQPRAGDYDEQDALARHEALLSQDRWTPGTPDDDDRPVLYTFVDLTDDDRVAVQRGERDLAAEVDAEVERIRPVVDAIARQVDAFFETDLPALLTDAVDRRRDRLAAHRAVLDTLAFPGRWKLATPTIEDAPPPQGVPSVDGQHRAEPGNGHLADENEGGAPEVVLGRPSRLADASFSDLLRTIRVWADAVERHPRAYRDLGEDRITDLLAATLTAALPGADREVFSNRGRSDIFVRGDVLSSGAAPAAVFVCECKIWHGQSKALEALDQLFGYVGVNDLAAVLIFYVRLTDPAGAQREAEPALRGRPDFVEPSVSPVEGWPVLQFAHRSRTVRVCVAFVALPDVAGQDGLPDAAHRAAGPEEPSDDN